MNANPTPRAGKAGFCLLALATLLTLTSCDPSYMGGGYGGGYGNYAPAPNRSNYTYYPQYHQYYHPQTNMYHYHNGTSWMSSPHPYGVNHTVIRNSPSVPLYLNSHPQYHHEGVGRAYPHNWNGYQNNNWRH